VTQCTVKWVITQQSTSDSQLFATDPILQLRQKTSLQHDIVDKAFNVNYFSYDGQISPLVRQNVSEASEQFGQMFFLRPSMSQNSLGRNRNKCTITSVPGFTEMFS